MSSRRLHLLCLEHDLERIPVGSQSLQFPPETVRALEALVCGRGMGAPTDGTRPNARRKRRLRARVEEVCQALSEFYSEEEIAAWLDSPQRLLGGDRPIDRLRRGKLRDVLALIDQIETGAFV